MAEDKGKVALAVGAIGLSTAALIAALTKKAKAAPEDEVVREALAAILALGADTQLRLDALSDIQAKSDAIIRAIESLGVEVPMVKKIQLIPYAYNLAIAGLPGSGVTLTEIAPFTGYIKLVRIHWPDGCNAWVDVKVGHGVTQFCPREGYLALNNATPSYEFNEAVVEGEDIWVEMRNGDGANPHNITVTIRVEEE